MKQCLARGHVGCGGLCGSHSCRQRWRSCATPGGAIWSAVSAARPVRCGLAVVCCRVSCVWWPSWGGIFGLGLRAAWHLASSVCVWWTGLSEWSVLPVVLGRFRELLAALVRLQQRTCVLCLFRAWQRVCADVASVGSGCGRCGSRRGWERFGSVGLVFDGVWPQFCKPDGSVRAGAPG